MIAIIAMGLGAFIMAVGVVAGFSLHNIIKEEESK